MTEPRMKLALGPVLYYWPQEKLLDFYERMSTAPVDVIYLGETVCSKRRAFNTEEWLELAERLRYDCIKAYVASALGDEDKAKAHFAAARQAIGEYVGPDLALITDQTRKPSRSQLKAYEQRKIDAADLAGAAHDARVRISHAGADE